MRMQLSKANLKNISSSSGVIIPDEKIFSFPEKVLQFGTGVLLRGLPDYFIDKANRLGMFNGRIVVVKSTGNSDASAEFAKQDNLYTLSVKGIENDNKMEEFIINSSISRVLSAKKDWTAILQCAHNPALQIIISNTTEVGIVLMDDNVHLSPPQSFPGKLLAFLYERYKTLGGDERSGMVIIPTELIPDNGSLLRAIILDLAKMNKLEEEFIDWLRTKNHFCNSLVDRIVPGKLPDAERVETEKMLGYSDDLMIMTEPFRLWAIETNKEEIRKLLSFSGADEGVVIAPDIAMFRELKLRLLNGTHTFVCGLAFLAGFKTVRESMNDVLFAGFIRNLVINEITVAIKDEKISYEEACKFANKVLDRFRNPFIDHQWLNISVQYSSKMKMRNIPLLEEHYRKYSTAPVNMALGFAAYILFMKCRKNEKGNYEGELNGIAYPVKDDYAGWFAQNWRNNNVAAVVDAVLKNKELWETDLSSLNDFAESVKANLSSLMENGVAATLLRMEENKTVAGL
jgi:tagaturonate reductase